MVLGGEGSEVKGHDPPVGAAPQPVDQQGDEDEEEEGGDGDDAGEPLRQRSLHPAHTLHFTPRPAGVDTLYFTARPAGGAQLTLEGVGFLVFASKFHTQTSKHQCDQNSLWPPGGTVAAHQQQQEYTAEQVEKYYDQK